jgi:uncharacterized protein YegL
MGLAKYREDDISRRGGTSSEVIKRRVRGGSPNAPGPTSPQKSMVDAAQTKGSTLKDFTVSTPRPLPVILLLDVSGSMSADGKIDALNESVASMLSTFTAEDATRAAIHVAIITFGKKGARIHQKLEPVTSVHWTPLEASGGTPLGAALDLATQLIEDHAQVPSRAYRPSLVLVSDGQPTDAWQEPLQTLLAAERAAKAARFAMGIGADADANMLSAFLANDLNRVFMAHEARQIIKFFRWVTMSVTTRSRSAQPDSVVQDEFIDLPDLDF